jgi:nitroimidazol reductase NimA-like FMN-containing flavoprotein (pyridoxamine 5'-phosphate oxidase superfamily)
MPNTQREKYMDARGLGAGESQAFGMETERDVTALGRHPERGHYDFETIVTILDAGIVCHVGVSASFGPVVIPTIYGRIARDLYLHGSAVTRWMNTAAESLPLCVTVTILDGLVLARSAYNHSMNYRSAVIFGNARSVDDPDEKVRALHAIMEHVCPGRWNDARHPSDGELRATLVLRVPIVQASAKVRTGPPIDFDFDLASRIWAGVVPIQTVRGAPIPDPVLPADIAVPAYCEEGA